MRHIIQHFHFTAIVHFPLPLFQELHHPYNEKYKYIRQFTWEVQMARGKSITGYWKSLIFLSGW